MKRVFLFVIGAVVIGVLGFMIYQNKYTNNIGEIGIISGSMLNVDFSGNHNISTGSENDGKDLYGCTTDRNWFLGLKGLSGQIINYTDYVISKEDGIYLDRALITGYGVYMFTMSGADINKFDIAPPSLFKDDTKTTYAYSHALMQKYFSEKKDYDDGRRVFEGQVPLGTTKVTITPILQQNKDVVLSQEKMVMKFDINSPQKGWYHNIDTTQLEQGVNQYLIKFYNTGYTFCGLKRIVYLPNNFTGVKIGSDTIKLPPEKDRMTLKKDDQYATSWCMFDRYQKAGEGVAPSATIPDYIEKKDKNGNIKQLSTCLVFSLKNGYVLELKGGKEPTDYWSVWYNDTLIDDSFLLLWKDNSYYYHYNSVPFNKNPRFFGAKLLTNYYQYLSEGRYEKAANISDQSVSKLQSLYKKDENIWPIVISENDGIYTMYVGSMDGKKEMPDYYLTQKIIQNNKIMSVSAKKVVTNNEDEYVKYYTDKTILIKDKKEVVLSDVYGNNISYITKNKTLQTIYNTNTAVQQYIFSRNIGTLQGDREIADTGSMKIYVIPNLMKYTDMRDVYSNFINEKIGLEVLGLNDNYILLGSAGQDMGMGDTIRSLIIQTIVLK